MMVLWVILDGEDVCWAWWGVEIPFKGFLNGWRLRHIIHSERGSRTGFTLAQPTDDSLFPAAGRQENELP